MRVLSSIVIALLSGSACIPLTDQNSCRTDDGCPADEVCTDVKECSRAEDAPPWRVTWTVDGQAASSEGACDGIDDLALEITSNADRVGYEPLACPAGSFAFVALPSDFNTARLEVRYLDGRLLRERGNRDGDAELVLDIESGL